MIPNSRAVLLLWAGLAATLRAAAAPAVLLPTYEYPSAMPELLAAATEAGLPTERFDTLPERRPAAAGDSATALISLRHGASVQQWLLNLTVENLAGAEADLPPLAGFRAFSSTGNEFNFPGRRLAVELRLIGPQEAGAAAGTAPKVQSRRVLVNAEHLEFGFDAACDAVLRLREAAGGKAGRPRLKYEMNATPFPAERVRANQAIAEKIGLTPDRERALTGAALALPEFLNLIMRTPGLQDSLRGVLDVSWWSVLASGGKITPRFRNLTEHMQHLPRDPSPGSFPLSAFPFLVLLNERPALACLLVVTEPRAPLAATSGVLAIHAGRPYDREPQLTVRLIATRHRDVAPVGTTAAAPAGQN